MISLITQGFRFWGGGRPSAVALNVSQLFRRGVFVRDYAGPRTASGIVKFMTAAAEGREADEDPDTTDGSPFLAHRCAPMSTVPSPGIVLGDPAVEVGPGSTATSRERFRRGIAWDSSRFLHP